MSSLRSDQLAFAIAVARVKPAHYSAEQFVSVLRECIAPERRDQHYLDGVRFWQRRYDQEHQRHLSLRAKVRSGQVLQPQFDAPLESAPALQHLPAIDLITRLRVMRDEAQADELFSEASVELVKALNCNRNVECADTLLALFTDTIAQKPHLDEVMLHNLNLHLLDLLLCKSKLVEPLLATLCAVNEPRSALQTPLFNAIVEHLHALLQGRRTKGALRKVELLCRLLQKLHHVDAAESHRRFHGLVKALHRYDAMERCIWQIGVLKRWIRFS